MLGTGKFQVSTPGVIDLELDFNPIIEQFNLEGDQWKLIHWQGRPKGDRQWGIYDPKTDQYRCGIFPDHRTAFGGINLLMLDDQTSTTLPTSVMDV